MNHSCREVVLALYSIIITTKGFASQSFLSTTLPQIEKLFTDKAILEKFKARVRELVEFQQNTPDLMNSRKLNEVNRELYAITAAADCREQLDAFISRESKSIETILIFTTKIMKFNREFNLDGLGPPESESSQYEYRKSIANLTQIAEEIGVELPPI